MKRIIAVGLIIAIAVNVTVVAIGFSLFQNEINQLKLEKSELENLIQNNSAQSTTQPEEQETNSRPEETSSSSPPELPTGQNFALKPSVPEFTWNFVDYSYDVPPVYEADPFTGESVMVMNGYHIDNRSMEITIKNQPFTPYECEDGNYTSLYYYIRLKGHYAEDWTYAPKTRSYGYHKATDSDYSVILLRLGDYGLTDLTNGGQIDLQVEALIGNDKRTLIFTMLGEGSKYEFTGETSEWSPIITITYPQDSSI